MLTFRIPLTGDEVQVHVFSRTAIVLNILWQVLLAVAA